MAEQNFKPESAIAKIESDESETSSENCELLRKNPLSTCRIDPQRSHHNRLTARSFMTVCGMTISRSRVTGFHRPDLRRVCR